MVACALIPRLSLRSALGGRDELIGVPVALAPEPGGPQVIGEASGAAEAFGIREGMRLAEALSRCPSLMLTTPDPVRAEAAWESSLRKLESIGAAVEPARAGEAFFETEGLRAVYGDAERVLARARAALGPPAKLGAAPNRICAHAAASRMRARRPAFVVAEPAARRLIAELPLTALRGRLGAAKPATDDSRLRETREAALIDSLERLGVRTLGELASLPSAALSDRFGRLGLRALALARGHEEPLRPRRRHEELACNLGLPEAASGQQLERALTLLVERLLAHPRRRGRTVRRLRIEARLAAGGGWRAEVTLRSATASGERLELALLPKLAELPGPASVLGLRALELGDEDADQATIDGSVPRERRTRLVEAIRQVRAAAGRDALLRVIDVDPDSRIPERRVLLSPFPELDESVPAPRRGTP